ncbi:MAG: hypothetical protein PF436_10760 [Prolixibacteraceae bacterium]|jgi:hypothetical protein|nr:hypothetical protein [Prolixibacteraceae bacterium]
MKKLFKITGIIILVIVIAILLIPFAFKGKISNAILAKANESVNAEISYGSYRLSILKSFPDFNASFNDVAVVGLGDFEGDTLLAFNELTVQVDIRSVFGGGSVVIQSLHLYKTLLQLIQNEAGAVNWAISKTGIPVANEKEAETGKTPLKLQLSEIEITDFDFIYNSEKYNYLFSVLNAEGYMSGIMSGMTTLLNIEASTPSINFGYDSVRYIDNGKLNLVTQLEADLDKYKFSFDAGKTRVNDLPVSINGGFSMPGDSMIFDVIFDVPEIDMLQLLSVVPNAFQKYLNEVEADGQVTFNGKVNGVYYEDIYPQMDIDLKVNNGTIKYPGLPETLLLNELLAGIKKPEGVLDLLTLGVEKMDMQMADNPFSMQAMFGTLLSDPFIDVDLNGLIDLGTLNKVIPMGDTKMTGMLKADAQMKGNYSSLKNNDFSTFISSGNVELNDFNFQNSAVPQGVWLETASMVLLDQNLKLKRVKGNIGQSDFSVDGTLSNVATWLFAGDELNGDMQLQSRYLNLNEFLKHYTPDEKPEKEDYIKTDSVSRENILLTLPEKMHLSFDARINRLLLDKMDITGFEGRLLLHDQQLELLGLQMQLIGGTMKMDGTLIADGRENPALNARIDIAGFDLPTAYQQLSIVQKYMPFAAKSQGRFSTKLKIESPLNREMKTMLSDLSASGIFSTEDVRLLNTNIFDKLKNVIKTSRFRNVGVDDFTTNFAIKNGNLEITPLNTKIAEQPVQLSGIYNMGGTIDFRVDAQVEKDVLSDEIQKIIAYIPGHQKVTIVDVGFNVKGDAKKPDVVVDNDKIKRQVLNQVKGSSREEIEDAAKKLLQELFK